jgi:hypothetical protein
MAAEKHLQIIRQGVRVWNEWRLKNPKTLRPNLSEAKLVGANLAKRTSAGRTSREQTSWGLF